MLSLDEIRGMENLGSRRILERLLCEEILVKKDVAVRIDKICIADVKSSEKNHEIRLLLGYAYSGDKKGKSQLFIYKNPEAFYLQLNGCADEFLNKCHSV